MRRTRMTTQWLLIAVAAVAIALGVSTVYKWCLDRSEAPNSAIRQKTLVVGKRRGILNGTGTLLAWNPDGRVLATNSTDQIFQRMILWDAASGGARAVLSGHAEIFGLAWSPDGKTLATGSWDRTAALWEVSKASRRSTLTGHSGKVFSVAWSPASPKGTCYIFFLGRLRQRGHAKGDRTRQRGQATFSSSVGLLVAGSLAVPSGRPWLGTSPRSPSAPRGSRCSGSGSGHRRTGAY